MSTDNTDDTVNGSNNNDHVAYIVANLQVLIPRWLEKYGYDYPIVVLDTSNWDWDNFVSLYFSDWHWLYILLIICLFKL